MYYSDHMPSYSAAVYRSIPITTVYSFCYKCDYRYAKYL